MYGAVATIVAILREQAEDRANLRRNLEVKCTQKIRAGALVGL